MKTGMVTCWKNGYGFILDDDSDESYFVNWRDIAGDGFKSLKIGEFGEYDLAPAHNGNGQMAVNVKIIG